MSWIFFFICRFVRLFDWFFCFTHFFCTFFLCCVPVVCVVCFSFFLFQVKILSLCPLFDPRNPWRKERQMDGGILIAIILACIVFTFALAMCGSRKSEEELNSNSNIDALLDTKLTTNSSKAKYVTLKGHNHQPNNKGSHVKRDSSRQRLEKKS